MRICHQIPSKHKVEGYAPIKLNRRTRSRKGRGQSINAIKDVGKMRPVSESNHDGRIFSPDSDTRHQKRCSKSDTDSTFKFMRLTRRAQGNKQVVQANYKSCCRFTISYILYQIMIRNNHKPFHSNDFPITKFPFNTRPAEELLPPSRTPY